MSMPINHRVLEDKDLVRLYQQGDQAAITQLVHRYKSRIYSSIFFLVRKREVAEDLFQETFIKIISGLRNSQYNEQGKFLPWALRVAHNQVIDHFRKEKLMPMQYDQEEYSVFDVMPSQGRNAADQLIQNEKLAYVRQLIDRLPPDQREIVILRHYAGLSFKEISKMLNINLNTALGRMHYAVLKMRDMVSQEPERVQA